MPSRLSFIPLLLVAALLARAEDAAAHPARIVILRHGEKRDAFRLCAIGNQRALALSSHYLGKGGTDSLFADGRDPAGFLAITPHTLELAGPSAATWGLPVTTYSSIKMPGQNGADLDRLLNRQTQQAAHDATRNPQWDGKTLVMVWEHHRIADDRLEKTYPNEKVTLRQLLNLDAIAAAPARWPGGNYDYFWIVDYASGSDQPSHFEMRKQTFTAPYQDVPANDWGAKNKLPKASKCE